MAGTKTQIANAAIAYKLADEDLGAAETDIENPNYHDDDDAAEERARAARQRLFNLIDTYQSEHAR